jgi:hypothetical protein
MIFSGHIINVLANINGEFSEGDINGIVLNKILFIVKSF